MPFSTADLYDAHESAVQIINLPFKDYGSTVRFYGAVATVSCFEDNSLVRTALEEPGCNRVLLVDGAGSLRVALLGDRLAALAMQNNWQGIVVNGAIRDSALIASMSIGVKAIATNPKKSKKQGKGERDIALKIGEAAIKPGDFLYADADGVLISGKALL